MNVKVLKNYEELSRETGELIVQLIHNKPKAVICLASGNSPLGVFEFLIDEVNNKRVDLTQVTFIGLDDFVGMGKEDDGSGANMLYHHFYIPAGIKDTQIHLFNTKTEDLDAECKRIDNIIFDNGGLDMILLGIGMNGHLGFNEPGVSFDLYSHVIELDETTKTVGQKYFKQQTPIDKGITLGIKHILEAKAAVVIADGVKKADVVQKMIQGPVTNEYPCTIISEHPNAYVFVDEAAYEKIK
jgi:glucosamine-6-phosphate isomerase